MKVKQKRTHARHGSSSPSPSFGGRPMDHNEAHRAELCIMSVLEKHPYGLSYKDTTPVGAILDKLDKRSDFGDKKRQQLVFKAVMERLYAAGRVKSDPVSMMVWRTTRSRP